MMTLPEFIEDLGDAKAAELFGVKERTAMSWRLRERVPRPAQAARIIEQAGGKLDYAAIYAPDAERVA